MVKVGWLTAVLFTVIIACIDWHNVDLRPFRNRSVRPPRGSTNPRRGGSAWAVFTVHFLYYDWLLLLPSFLFGIFRIIFMNKFFFKYTPKRNGNKIFEEWKKWKKKKKNKMEIRLYIKSISLFIYPIYYSERAEFLFKLY